jgi:hypothetical protein
MRLRTRHMQLRRRQLRMRAHMQLRTVCMPYRVQLLKNIEYKSGGARLGRAARQIPFAEVE